MNIYYMCEMGFPVGLAGKESTCNVVDLDLIPQLGRSSGEGKGYPLQYSGLGNSIDCIAHGVSKSQTQLSNFRFTSLLVVLEDVIEHQGDKVFCSRSVS